MIPIKTKDHWLHCEYQNYLISSANKYRRSIRQKKTYTITLKNDLSKPIYRHSLRHHRNNRGSYLYNLNQYGTFPHLWLKPCGMWTGLACSRIDSEILKLKARRAHVAGSRTWERTLQWKPILWGKEILLAVFSWAGNSLFFLKKTIHTHWLTLIQTCCWELLDFA